MFAVQKTNSSSVGASVLCFEMTHSSLEIPLGRSGRFTIFSRCKGPLKQGCTETQALRTLNITPLTLVRTEDVYKIVLFSLQKIILISY